MIEFGEFPAVFYGHEVERVRLVFEHGRVVDASAREGEDFLLQTLDLDEGPGASASSASAQSGHPALHEERRLRRQDQRHLYRLGNSYSFTGGKNVSAIHWDIVKDLRSGGRLYADGRLVQEGGRWL